MNGVELKTQSQVPNTRHEKVPEKDSSVGATKNLRNDTAGSMEKGNKAQMVTWLSCIL